MNLKQYTFISFINHRYSYNHLNHNLAFVRPQSQQVHRHSRNRQSKDFSQVEPTTTSRKITKTVASSLILSSSSLPSIQKLGIEDMPTKITNSTIFNESYCQTQQQRSSFHTAMSRFSSSQSSSDTNQDTIGLFPIFINAIEMHSVNSCNGHVVARIIPEEYKDYNAQKPNSFRINVNSRDHGGDTYNMMSKYHALIESHLQARQENNNMYTTNDEHHHHDMDFITDKLVKVVNTDGSSKSKGENASNLCVVIDLDVKIPILNNQECTNSNDNSKDKDIGLLENSTQYSSSPNNATTTTAHEPIHVIMNRDANENATRTLERLYISTNKKISKLLNKKSKKEKKKKTSGKNKNNNDSKVQKLVMKQDDMDNTRTTHNSNKVDDDQNLVPCIYLDQRHNNNSDVDDESIHKIDIDTLTTMDLLRHIDATTHTTPNSIEDNNNTISSSSKNYRITIPGSSQTENLPFVSNPPTILSIQTPFENFQTEIVVGIPLTLQASILHSNKVIVSWFVDNDTLVAYDTLYFIPSLEHIGKVVTVLIQPLYVIDEQHVILGEEEAYQFQNKIAALPSMPIVSPLRDEFCNVQRNQSTIRVATYNILADLYVSKDLYNQELTSPHAHVKEYDLLRKTRRLPMIIAELLSYKADIICLQEVDGGSIYSSFIEPVLNVMNYDGYYSNKASCQREGCALFWSRDVFNVENELVDLRSFSLRDLFELDNEDVISASSPSSKQCEWDECMNEIKTLLCSHDELRKVTISKIGQIVQIATLHLKDPCSTFAIDTQIGSSASTSQQKIVVANTHLFYHPMADHIRALQAFVVCKKLDDIRRSKGNDNALGDEHTNPSPILLCGDLNSDPLSGAAQLLFTRELNPGHHDCWKNLHEYKWDCGDNDFMLEHGYVGNEVGVTNLKYEEEAFNNAADEMEVASNNTNSSSGSSSLPPPPLLVLPPCFPSLKSGCLEVPKFTNYAVDFIDTLDYVLASEPSEVEPYGFKPIRSSPMPAEEDVTKFIAMPNECMPSDHVSVVCDLEFVKFQAKQE